MSIRICLLSVITFVIALDCEAKSWRGIVPLKSTRADVERLLGKPNSYGRYEFADERAYIQYREDPCVGAYRPLQRMTCECLVSTDTVVSIHVDLEVVRTFSSLRVDKSKFERKPHHVAAFADYSDSIEGVTYTVDDSSDEIVSTAYGPSAADCQDLIANNLPPYRNTWRGLVPLHSNRADVERVMGAAYDAKESLYTYITDNERFTVRYSTGTCESGGNQWNVPAGVITEFWVNPMPPFLIRSLRLDPNRFQREESPLPENLGKRVNYTDEANGVIIRASDRGTGEEIISITYSPSRKDAKLRCQGSSVNQR